MYKKWRRRGVENRCFLRCYESFLSRILKDCAEGENTSSNFFKLFMCLISEKLRLTFFSKNNSSTFIEKYFCFSWWLSKKDVCILEMMCYTVIWKYSGIHKATSNTVTCIIVGTNVCCNHLHNPPTGKYRRSSTFLKDKFSPLPFKENVKMAIHCTNCV